MLDYKQLEEKIRKEVKNEIINNLKVNVSTERHLGFNKTKLVINVLYDDINICESSSYIPV